MIVDETDPPPLYKQFGHENFMKAWRIPHTMALGVEMVRVRRAEALFRAPYREAYVGDPSSGVVHGGLITTLLDQTSGAAVFCASETLTMFATLDLRIDYMRPAEPGRDVLAKANCMKFGRNIAFVHGVAYEDDPDNPIAVSQGAFMAVDAPKPPQAAADAQAVQAKGAA